MAEKMKDYRVLNGRKEIKQLVTKGQIIGACRDCRGPVIRKPDGEEVCTGCGVVYTSNAMVLPRTSG